MLTELGLIIGAIALLASIILFHECGHFFMAKACRVEVQKLQIGFGRPWLSRKMGATSYQLGWIPLGGLTHIEQLDRVKLTKRLLILAAGPLANGLLSCLLFAGLTWHGYEQPRPILAGLEDSHTAASISFPSLITAVDGQPVQTWQDVYFAISPAINTDVVTLQLSTWPATDSATTQPFQLKVITDSTQGTNLGLIPWAPPETAQKVDGSTQAADKKRPTVWIQAEGLDGLQCGAYQTWQWLYYDVIMLCKLMTSDIPLSAMLGPIGMIKASMKAISLGWSAILGLVAVISVFVMLFNLLPLPGLDGFGILRGIGEKVTRREMSQRVYHFCIQLTLIAWLVLLAHISILEIFY